MAVIHVKFEIFVQEGATFSAEGSGGLLASPLPSPHDDDDSDNIHDKDEDKPLTTVTSLVLQMDDLLHIILTLYTLYSIQEKCGKEYCLQTMNRVKCLLILPKYSNNLYIPASRVNLSLKTQKSGQKSVYCCPYCVIPKFAL